VYPGGAPLGSLLTDVTALIEEKRPQASLAVR
jgi:hypothetical protein